MARRKAPEPPSGADGTPPPELFDGDVVTRMVGFVEAGDPPGGHAAFRRLKEAHGTLTVQYAPTQRSLVQSAVWEVVSGTGSFEGLRGGGSMVAAFESDNPDSGREIFTGTVSP